MITSQIHAPTPSLAEQIGSFDKLSIREKYGRKLINRVKMFIKQVNLLRKENEIPNTETIPLVFYKGDLGNQEVRDYICQKADIGLLIRTE